MVEEPEHARDLNPAQSQKDSRPGFDRLEREAKRQIQDEKALEPIAGAFLMAPSRDGPRGDQAERDDLVELRRMPAHAVSKVHAPWKRGGQAVGVIVEPREEAADTPDRHPQTQRQHEQVAGGPRLADPPLHPLDGDQAAEQSADDGLAAEQVVEIGAVSPGGQRILEPHQQFRSERGADRGGGDHAPAGGVRNLVAP
jgi:hypothetical protein